MMKIPKNIFNKEEEELIHIFLQVILNLCSYVERSILVIYLNLDQGIEQEDQRVDYAIWHLTLEPKFM